MLKTIKEWEIPAPWGKIALISWGDPAGYPILLVHGRQDSASTFVPLLRLLPQHYHYVAVDLPGHGRSDPLPVGLTLMRFHFMGAIDLVVKHLNWTEFYYLAHSMGSELGFFFNSIYPHKVKKFVHLDPGPPLQRSQILHFSEYFNRFHEKYFKDYDTYNASSRVYSKAKALDAVKRARKLNDEQAELILERNLIQVGDDLYKLSWDKRLSFPAPLNLPDTYITQLYSLNAPPTLVIAASEALGYLKGKPAVDKMLQTWSENLKNFRVVKVEGGHDLHFVYPDRIAKEVAQFLDKEFELKAKL